MGQVLITEEYLQNMADALREKTGTSDPIAPKDFATTVEEIPVGPGPSPTPVDPDDPVGSQYGAVLYWPTYKQGWFNPGGNGGRGCIINSVDADKLNAFISAFPQAWGQSFEFSMNYSSWEQKWSYYYNDGSDNSVEMKLDTESVEELLGIDVTITDESEMSMVELRVVQGRVPDETVQTVFLNLTSASDMNALADTSNKPDRNNPYDWTYTINGTQIPKECVKRFVFGSQVTTIPGGFLYASGLRSLAPIPANITTIGDAQHHTLSSLYSFNSPLTFQGGFTSGYRTFSDLPKFNNPITFSGGAVVLNGEFLVDCPVLDQDIDFKGLVSSSNNFLQGCGITNKTITLPSTVNSMQTMGTNCFKFVGTLVCNCPASVCDDQYDSFFMDQTYSGVAPLVTIGFAYGGTYASEWATKFPTVEGQRKIRTA